MCKRNLQKFHEACKYWRMNLPSYIEKVGDEVAAGLFEAEVRTVQSWRRRERVPRPAKAREIVFKTNGEVSFAEIYDIQPSTVQAA